MTPDQENHLRDVKYDFLNEVDRKYRAGQIEHGGDLWMKPGVLEMALEEAVDMYVYLHVLKQQRDNPSIINKNKHDTR